LIRTLHQITSALACRAQGCLFIPSQRGRRAHLANGRAIRSRHYQAGGRILCVGIIEANIARFKKLILSETDPIKRSMEQRLLAEEEWKLKHLSANDEETKAF